VDEVKAYVKNQNLGFKIPYTFEGRPGNYYPDYILRVDDGRGMDDLLNLVVEISGQELADKDAKVDTARKLWVPAVNAEGTFGRWDFLEIKDPWDGQNALRGFLASRNGNGENTMGSGTGDLPRPYEEGTMDSATDDLIQKTPGVLGGDACIGKRRIAVWMLVRARQLGVSDEQLLKDYQPPLTRAELDAAWRYYESHRDEIETAIRENEEDD
jgi:uncharacterized protein (DUF433 family)